MIRGNPWWYVTLLATGGAAFLGWWLSDFSSTPEVGSAPREKTRQEDRILSRSLSIKPEVPDSQKSHRNSPAALSVPKEWVFTFGNESDLNAFLYQVAKLGGRIMGVIPRLGAARIGFDSDQQSAAILEAAAQKARSANNFVVAAPRPSEPIADTGGPYLGFGTEALTWLGVPMDNSTWGQGITVAVIDGGVSPDAAISAQSLTQLDLIGGTSVDSFEHGTAVASILGGSESGSRGLVPGADLLSVRVLDANGVGDSFTTAQGIMEAVDRGARVISLSLGTAGDSQVLRDAVNYAIARNVAVVAAVGNDGIEGVYYPANYPGVIAVSAIDATGRRGEFSNFGQSVALAAPGVGVSTPGTNNQQISFSGTSAAAPFVSGTVAMLLAKNPGLTANQAAELMVKYSDDAGAPGRDPQYGSGILNVNRLLTRNQSGRIAPMKNDTGERKSLRHNL